MTNAVKVKKGIEAFEGSVRMAMEELSQNQVKTVSVEDLVNATNQKSELNADVGESKIRNKRSF